MTGISICLSKCSTNSTDTNTFVIADYRPFSLSVFCTDNLMECDIFFISEGAPKRPLFYICYQLFSSINQFRNLCDHCFTHAHFFINFPHSGQAIGFLCLLRTFFTASLQMATPTSSKSDSQFSS
ncbi:hypothetical protein BpHYR1_003060 [Brachionus plicatilis]|uniref:Uncharacterized protein n=1 Tax=Brachionus plicatilis TaxID=10195 RepID=A0A3M7SEB9_BRAPC|nr:hypothetical protein BpHYR1_003060 [Brachionus plicatilis]